MSVSTMSSYTFAGLIKTLFGLRSSRDLSTSAFSRQRSDVERTCKHDPHILVKTVQGNEELPDDGLGGGGREALPHQVILQVVETQCQGLHDDTRMVLLLRPVSECIETFHYVSSPRWRLAAWLVKGDKSGRVFQLLTVTVVALGSRFG